LSKIITIKVLMICGSKSAENDGLFVFQEFKIVFYFEGCFKKLIIISIWWIIYQWMVKNHNYQLLCTHCVSKCQLWIDVILCGWIKLAIYWTNAAISLLPIPHISQPYNNTGFTILSKKSNWHYSGQNYVVVKNQNYQLLCTNCVSKCQLWIDVIFCGWIKLAIYWTNAACLISERGSMSLNLTIIYKF
jgi:hypothetical protein